MAEFQRRALSERSQAQRPANGRLYLHDTVEKAEPWERIRGATHGNEIDHKIATVCHDRNIPCLANAGGCRVSCGGYCV